jgi:hypothetical protein
MFIDENKLFISFFEPTWPFHLKFNLSKTIYFLKRTLIPLRSVKISGLLAVKCQATENTYFKNSSENLKEIN